MGGRKPLLSTPLPGEVPFDLLTLKGKERIRKCDDLVYVPLPMISSGPPPNFTGKSVAEVGQGSACYPLSPVDKHIDQVAGGGIGRAEVRIDNILKRWRCIGTRIGTIDNRLDVHLKPAVVENKQLTPAVSRRPDHRGEIRVTGCGQMTGKKDGLIAERGGIGADEVLRRPIEDHRIRRGTIGGGYSTGSVKQAPRFIRPSQYAGSRESDR